MQFVTKLNCNVFMSSNILDTYIFTYIKMSKIHQLNIMRLIKKTPKEAYKRYQIILKGAKEKNNNMVVNDI